MALETESWNTYWNSEDYSQWKQKGEDTWGDTSFASYDSSKDRETYSWDSDLANSNRDARTAGNVLGGAAVGAAAGSVLGPIGGIIGSVLGGLFGWLFGLGNDTTEQDKKTYNSYLNEIIYNKENLTTEYNQALEDLQTQKDRLLEQLNTQNERYQRLTDKTISDRNSQEQVTATQIYAQSKENTSQIREMQTELVKDTASQTSNLATSGFRNTGSAQSSIAYSYEQGEEKIKDTKYQMDVSLYVSNSQMASNYSSSTYTAYSYQDSISDNITSYQQWLEDLETTLTRTKEKYDREMEKYDEALEELTQTQDYNGFGTFLSGLTSGAGSVINIGKTFLSGASLLSSKA